MPSDLLHRRDADARPGASPPRTAARRRFTCAALASTVTLALLAGCSGDDDDDDDASSTTTSTVERTTTSEGGGTTSTSTASTIATDPSVAADLGEPFELGPQAGDLLAVVGVAVDETMAVRAAPAGDAEVVQELEPTATGLEATGEARINDNTIWYEVTADDVGWVEASGLAYIGLTDDATAEVVEQLGSLPEAASMVELGQVVAEALASDSGEPRASQTVEVSDGDPAGVTFDLVGLADDAVSGYRLDLFATPTADGFALDTVERTYLCARGVDGTGLCV